MHLSQLCVNTSNRRLLFRLLPDCLTKSCAISVHNFCTQTDWQLQGRGYRELLPVTLVKTARFSLVSCSLVIREWTPVWINGVTTASGVSMERIPRKCKFTVPQWWLCEFNPSFWLSSLVFLFTIWHFWERSEQPEDKHCLEILVELAKNLSLFRK